MFSCLLAKIVKVSISLEFPAIRYITRNLDSTPQCGARFARQEAHTKMDEKKKRKKRGADV